MNRRNAADVIAVNGGRKSLGDAASRRFWKLESTTLCANARRKTALDDFGDPPIESALSVLLESLESEANLHPLGRFLIYSHLQEILETRLQLNQLWKEQSGAPNTNPIQRPVFITGMPRSGSTFLHELLAQDTANRAPKVWEVMFPIPAPDTELHHHNSRIRKTAFCLWWFRRMAPQADSVYPMRAHTPHECVAIHSYSLLSEEFVSTCNVPSYEAHLRSTGLAAAYAWEKRFLQHLQSRSPGKQWILKSPDHSFGLEELFSTFPDAMVIQTHRSPLEVLRSSSQLIPVLRSVFAHRSDHYELAMREARVLAEAMHRFIEFRDSHPELADRFFDVKYTELISDPLSIVRQIYRHLEIPLIETTENRMLHLVANRSRHSGHLSNPTLAEMGFDVPAETRRFNDYSLRFGVAC